MTPDQIEKLKRALLEAKTQGHWPCTAYSALKPGWNVDNFIEYIESNKLKPILEALLRVVQVQGEALKHYAVPETANWSNCASEALKAADEELNKLITTKENEK